jgi:hypothetical protein
MKRDAGRKLRAAAVAAVITVGSPHLANGTVIYVDTSAAGANTGTSWTDAFSDLQDALAPATTGDEIWVAVGTYTPSDTDATASFFMKPGVALYGGFDGTETAREQRDWETNLSVLSGDIGRDDIVSPWPSGWNINTSNVGHVVVGSGTDRASVLDGFIIENGHTGPAGTSAGDPLLYGSGIYIVSGSPTVRNCTFRHNLAAFAAGGGLYCLDGSPLVENCRFVENYVHSGNGGGIFVYGNSQPEFRDSRFIGNICVSTSASGGDGSAGALGIQSTLPVTVERCLFDGNIARPFFAVGQDLAYGGGLWVWDGGLTVVDCTFVRNQANYGAGLMAWGPATVINCLFQNNTATVHPMDPYPEGGGEGAGLMAWSASPDVVDVINCTVAYNRGKKHVGLVSAWTAHLNIQNTIVWGNTGTSPEVVGYWPEQLEGSFDAAYSCIAMIFDPPAPGEDPIEPENLPGCIDTAPLFVQASASGDLHLLTDSPCIDAGNNAFVPGGVALDLDGNPRFFDNPSKPDSGAGTAPIVDMGAFEFFIPTLAGDFDGDGDVDTADFAIFGQCFGGALNPQAPACPAGVDADLDGDGDVDTADFAIFSHHFTGSQ